MKKAFNIGFFICTFLFKVDGGFVSILAKVILTLDKQYERT